MFLVPKVLALPLAPDSCRPKCTNINKCILPFSPHIHMMKLQRGKRTGVLDEKAIRLWFELGAFPEDQDQHEGLIELIC